MSAHLYSETKPWIDMTRKVIQHKHSAKLKANNESLVYRILEEVYNDLAGPSSMWKWSEKLQSALAEILQSCVDFAQLLHRQSAIYEVHLPKVVGSAGHRRKFDSTFLEDVKNGDEEEVQNRTVEITLFPAVLKFGNERRENVRRPASLN